VLHRVYSTELGGTARERGREGGRGESAGESEGWGRE